MNFKQYLADSQTLNELAPMNLGMSQVPSMQVHNPSNTLNGTLTDNEKRVLAILSSPQVKSSPGLARGMLRGDNMVAAVKTLKDNFKAIDVSPDGVTINTVGTQIASNQGITDPNTGELSELGNTLAAPSSNVPTSSTNPVTPPTSVPGQMESLSLLKSLIQ
jgi:hypothetical protein